MAAIQSEPVVKTLTMNRRLLTVAQTAELLQVSRKTVISLIESGTLPAIQVGQRYRIWTSDLETLGNSQPLVARANQPYETAAFRH